MTHKSCIEQDTSSTQTSTDNFIKIDISMGTKDVAKKGDTVKISLQSLGKVLERKISYEVWDPITKDSTNNLVKCSDSAAPDTVDFICIVDYHHKQLQT